MRILSSGYLKKIAYAGSASLTSASFALSAFAQSFTDRAQQIESTYGTGNAEGSITKVIGQVANIFGTVILALAIIMILISAFNFLTAAGNEDKVKMARTTLLYALVGVAVALFSFALPSIVLSIFGVR